MIELIGFKFPSLDGSLRNGMLFMGSVSQSPEHELQNLSFTFLI